MIRVQIEGGSELTAYLDNVGPNIVSSVERAMLRIIISLQRYIILNKLEGNPLHHRTGNLERALVYTEPVNDGGVITATVGVSKLAPYGKIHEYGGTISVPEHFRKSVLGKEFSVRAHLAHYPERSFLRSSLRENESTIAQAITRAVNEAL